MNALLLEFKNVSLHLTGIEKTILAPFSYSVSREDCVMVIGANGSGKSSLFKLIDGRYSPSGGEILFAGRSIKTLTQDPSDSLFESLTVFENALVVKQHYEPRLFSLNEKTEKESFANYLKDFNISLAHKLDQRVERLSGGEKQALALALTVRYPPDLLLLDEHTSALDPKSAERIMDLTFKVIAEHQITSLVITHNLELACRYGNRVLALKEGEIHQMIESDEKAGLIEAELLKRCY